jgi:hypothetical protein
MMDKAQKPSNSELIEEHRHKVLHIPQYHGHINSTELDWSQNKRYYNDSLGQNGFGIEGVKMMSNYWNRSVCFSVLTTNQRFGVSHIITSIANLLYNITLL